MDHIARNFSMGKRACQEYFYGSRKNLIAFTGGLYNMLNFLDNSGGVIKRFDEARKISVLKPLDSLEKIFILLHPPAAFRNVYSSDSSHGVR